MISSRRPGDGGEMAGLLSGRLVKTGKEAAPGQAINRSHVIKPPPKRVDRRDAAAAETTVMSVLSPTRS
jgi:hypothetical protein